MPANRQPQTLVVTGNENRVVYSNILIGDIWLLGGQSNMEFDLERTFDGELEIMAAENPDIRMISIPHAASGEKVWKDFERIVEFDDFLKVYEDKGTWMRCYPDKVQKFSSLGYMFGKTLNEITKVPIGLIDVSWGGTTLEAWLSPEKLAEMPENAEMLSYWKGMVDAYNPKEDLKKQIENWKKRNDSRKEQGQEPLPKPTEPSPSPIVNRSYPGASYNGHIAPIKGFALKGVVFHHGFNNALGDSRPSIYAADFDGLIDDWRKTFNDEKMPFGIIELCAGGTPQTLDNFEVAMQDAAPYIKEGQYQAYLNNENVGFCCAYDQQVNWYHPQKKLMIGVRMARWALSEVYGLKNVVWEPARVVDVVKNDTAFIITFDKEVKGSDDRPMDGFAIAGADRHFYPTVAQYGYKAEKDDRGRAEVDKKKLVIFNPLVKHPEAVRYAWARCPMGNLVSNRIIPVPQFRTDKWEYPEGPFGDGTVMGQHRKLMRSLPRQAMELVKTRKIQEAEYILKNNK